MSKSGWYFIAFLFSLVAILAAGAFLFLGLEYAALTAALGTISILVLILAKYAKGSNDFWVYLFFAVVVIVAGIHFSAKGFGIGMVGNQLANAGWVTIDGYNYSVRGSEFGTYTTADAGGSSFERAGWFAGDQMVYNGKTYGVFATFSGLPIVATAGVGDHRYVVFTAR